MDRLCRQLAGASPSLRSPLADSPNMRLQWQRVFLHTTHNIPGNLAAAKVQISASGVSTSPAVFSQGSAAQNLNYSEHLPFFAGI